MAQLEGGGGNPTYKEGKRRTANLRTKTFPWQGRKRKYNEAKYSQVGFVYEVYFAPASTEIESRLRLFGFAEREAIKEN